MCFVVLKGPAPRDAADELDAVAIDAQGNRERGEAA